MEGALLVVGLANAAMLDGEAVDATAVDATAVDAVAAELFAAEPPIWSNNPSDEDEAGSDGAGEPALDFNCG